MSKKEKKFQATILLEQRHREFLKRKRDEGNIMSAVIADALDLLIAREGKVKK